MYFISKVDSCVLKTIWRGSDYIVRLLVVSWFRSCSGYRIWRDKIIEKTMVVKVVE